ncbi:hypothetical protein AAHE18_12G198100 [Arachis hypogaea]
MDTLLKLFHRVRHWEESKRCNTRRTWLACYGIPLHAWSPVMFQKLGEQWVDVIQCDVTTGEGASFTAGRVQVETEVFDEIRKWVQIAVGNSEYRVFVKEVDLQISAAAGVEMSRTDCAEKIVSDGAGTVLAKGAGSWDPAAKLVAGSPMVAVQGEDRIVINDIFLNDVNIDFLKFKKDMHVPDSGNGTKDDRIDDSQGFDEVNEGESEKNGHADMWHWGWRSSCHV